MGEYFYPEYELQVGGYIISEGVRLHLQFDQEISLDWIIITWTEKLIHAIAVSIGDEISLSVGYSGGLTKIFEGYVTSVEELQVIGKNEMLKMNRTKIVKTFKECTPEDVLTFVLNEAGISNFEINSEKPIVKKLYNVSNLSAMEVLRDIDRFFQLGKSTNVFNLKKFEWNVKPPSGASYVFTYAENIISLESIKENYWELETVLVTGIRVLNDITVNHPNIAGTFTVERINYFIDENGFVRLKLLFSEV